MREVWIACAYCGKRRPWFGPDRRKVWSSFLYAVCWPCAIRQGWGWWRPEPRWWNALARLVSIEWERVP